MPGVAAALVNAELGVSAFHTFGVALNKACARPPWRRGRSGSWATLWSPCWRTPPPRRPTRPRPSWSTTSRSRRSSTEDALAPDAPIQFDELGSNLAAGLRDAEDGDVLAGADVVVRGRFVNQRAVVPMEGNAIAVIPGRARR